MSNIGRYPTSSLIPGSITQVTAQDTNVVTPMAGNIIITGGTGITTTGAGSTLTINGTSGNIAWSVETVDTAMSSNHGYIPNLAGPINFTLPVSSSVGDIIKITQNIGAINVADVWKINQGAGQSIACSALTSTVGVAGFIRADSIAGVVSRASVELVCIEADLKWLVVFVSYGLIKTS